MALVDSITALAQTIAADIKSLTTTLSSHTHQVTSLTSTGAVSGHVATANGSGGVTWEEQGGAGGAGGDIVVVRHGTNGSVTRPEGANVVWWIGTAEPINAIAHDSWDNSGEVA